MKIKVWIDAQDATPETPNTDRQVLIDAPIEAAMRNGRLKIEIDPDTDEPVYRFGWNAAMAIQCDPTRFKDQSTRRLNEYAVWAEDTESGSIGTTCHVLTDADIDKAARLVEAAMSMELDTITGGNGTVTVIKEGQ